MASKNIRPRWWQLYLTFPLLIALFIVDSRLKLSSRGHQVVQVGIVLLVYGLIRLWLKENARALSRMDQQKSYGTIRVMRIPVVSDSEADNQRRFILNLPDSEIRGLLSNTADLDYVDAESTSIQEPYKN